MSNVESQRVDADFSNDSLVLTHPDKMKALRTAKRQGVESFAESVGLSDDIIKFTEGKLKNGKRVRTKWFNVRQVAQYCGVPPHDLLDWSEDQPVPSGWTQVEFAEQHRNSAINSTWLLLASAATESSPAMIRSSLNKALALIRPLVEDRLVPHAARLFALVLTRLADIESQYDRRVEYRRLAVTALETSCESFHEPLDVISWADAVVTYHYDIHSPPSKNWIIKQIKKALIAINAAEKLLRAEGLERERLRVLLLAQATSLLRCRHAYVSGDEIRNNLWNMLKAGDRCLELEGNNAIALLASGQAHWTYSLHVRNNYTAVHLQTAENHLKKAASISALGALVLSRFYRMTYKPADAIRTFKEFEGRVNEPRLVLMEAHIVAEAARQLWLKDGDAALPDVQYARRLISEAIEAGYREARTICGLAFLEGILGNEEVAKNQLQRSVIDDDTQTQLGQVLLSILDYAENCDVDKLRSVFVFGFDTGLGLNALGSFVADFWHDQELALRLYEMGLTLSARDPVLWLNKARALRALGRESEVAYPLQQARLYASTVFDRHIEEFKNNPQV